VLPNSTMPILKNILVVPDGGRLRLSATTLEIGIQVWIDAQIEQAGTTALPADLFTKIVNTFKAGKLTLSVPEGSQTLKVEGVGSYSNIRGVDPREFPIIPGVEGTETALVINAGAFRKMIESVVFAAEKDTTRPVWSSVKMELSETSFALVAADTFRLTRRMDPLPAGGQVQPIGILIPARCLHELSRILPNVGQLKIVVTPARNQVVFSLEQGERIDFVSRLVEGTYPNYQKAIPTAHQTRAIVDTKELITRLEQAAIFATDSKRCVRVTFKSAQSGSLFGGLLIESDHPDAGNTVGSVSAEITGLDQQIFFNVQYLLDALNHIDSPQVAVEAIASGRPVLLKPMADIDYVNMVQTLLPPSAA
jgi:DNA polymerase III subunit beta